MARKAPGTPGTLAQLRMVWSQSRALDPKLVPVTLGVLAVGFAAPFTTLLLLGYPVIGVVAGIFAAVLAALAVFGRRASTVQLAAIEGQPGAAAAVVQSMRGIWRITPAVAFSAKQDVVHRVVGRPGVVLIGEGAPARVAQLLAQEKRRVARVAGEIPVHELSVGTGGGQVPLAALRMHLMRLPRAVKPREIGGLERKMSALGERNIPIPKGPMPRVSRRMR